MAVRIGKIKFTRSFWKVLLGLKILLEVESLEAGLKDSSGSSAG